jgi:hypothetical protein
MIDLKTYGGASGFQQMIKGFLYDIQEAFYRMVADAIGSPVDRFFFIFVRDTPPHPVDVVEIHIGWHDYATESVQEALSDLARRYVDNDWQPDGNDKPRKVYKPNYLKG